MKGTIYRNRLSKGTQVKKGWKPLSYGRMMSTVGVDSSRSSAAKPTYVRYLPCLLTFLLT